MAIPDPYPPSAPVAVADEETATMDEPEETDDAAEETDEESSDSGKVLRNHLYLDKSFPSDPKPKVGEKKKFIVEAEYVEMKGDQQCWKELTVDGVPLTDEAAKTQEEEEGTDELPDASAATGEDPAQMPEASSNPVTRSILGQ